MTESSESGGGGGGEKGGWKGELRFQETQTQRERGQSCVNGKDKHVS